MDLNQFIALALEEDLGDGDHTSLSCIPESATGTAELLVKEPGILAGMDVAKQIFKTVDGQLAFIPILANGDEVKEGDIAFRIGGHSRSITMAERLVLNCMQRMSGIATHTRSIVQLLEGTNTKLLDTRKTTPGFRALEKMAVKIGGGHNHRMGLYDMIMIKDNHIDYAGGITAAIQSCKRYLSEKGKDLKMEVEARDMVEIQEILDNEGVFRILLDNFSVQQTKEAVALIAGRCETESSGGITIDTIRSYADCGVDYISVGALTHNVKSLDLSLKAVK